MEKNDIKKANRNCSMSEKENNLSRRDFIKTAGAAGLGAVAASMSNLAYASKKTDPDTIPTRPFGKTGVNVPILSFGGSHDLTSKQLLLRQAVKMGVTYWDTAYTYSNSEEAMGSYFEKFPQYRKKIFLVSKAKSSDPDEMTKCLNKSLERLKTSYIDLYFVHQVSDVKDDMGKETKAWAEKAKARGKIRFFGFSTHKNMENCLTEGAELGWIDGIMMSYNYRLMHTDAMKKAVDICVKSGIGLTAMKTQASGFLTSLWADLGDDSKASARITEHFMNKGFTIEQAKLKAVWENPHIASICSEMTNMTILKANVAAAMDKTKLTSAEIKMFDRYAVETDYSYCSGCADICESSAECDLAVSDVLRYMMYYHGYEDKDKARRLFSQIPLQIQRQLIETDFTKAEKKCPKKIRIAKYMKEAYKTLA